MKLILFDIDGTLVSVDRALTRDLVHTLLREALDHHEIVDGFELHGKTDRQIMRELCVAVGRGNGAVEDHCSHMERLLLEFWDTHLDENTVEILPGVKDLLETLSATEGVQLGLLTGNLEPAAWLKLRIHGLDGCFSFGAFGSDAESRNDLPPIALERAGAGAAYARTLIIGDSHRDIECARAWGISVLAVATGSLSVEHLRMHNPDAVVDTLLDTRFLHEFIATP